MADISTVFKELSSKEKDRIRQHEDQIRNSPGMWHVSSGKVYDYNFGFGQEQRHVHVTPWQVGWHERMRRRLSELGKTVHDFVFVYQARYDLIHEKIARCATCTEIYVGYTRTHAY